MEITLFRHLKDVTTPFHRDIDFAIQRIRNGKSKELIQLIRKEKDKSIRNELKQKLPSYCFGGKFSSRSTAGLIEPSGLMTIDIDNLSKSDLKNYFDILKADCYTYVCFLSPSGDGIKVLVKIPIQSMDEYKLFLKAYFDYLSALGLIGIDEATSDITRVCYESYDPNIYVNDNCSVFTEKWIPEEIGYVNVDIPLQSEVIIVENLLKWFESKYKMVEGERNSNLFKFAMALNDFGIDKMTAENVCSRYITNDFKHDEVLSIVKSAYQRGQSTFGTKFFEDKTKRDELEKAIINGYSFDRMQQILPNKTKRELGVIIEKITEAKTVDKFWSITPKGMISLIPHKFKFWLESYGFFKHYPKDGQIFSFVQRTNNIVKNTDEKRIKDFVLNWLMNNESDGYTVYDFMAKSSKFFSFEFLSFLSTENLSIKQDGQNDAFFYYQNGAVKITKDKVELIDYVDLDGFVWENQMINRDFTEHSIDGEFKRFVELISGDPMRFESVRSVIGFMLHSRSDAKNRAIILNDEKISDNPNGGSGKSLLASSLKYLKKYVSIDGKKFEFEKSFAFQTVGLDTQVLVFNDVKKNFNFENLFSVITEGITIEYKNQGAVTLPLSESPKIMITTNYTIQGSGGSHDRRKFEVELSDYFSVFHSPLKEFGRMMFDDWNESDWKAYDNFMIDCVQLYLEKGLVQVEYKNLAVRKFIGATSHEFYEWTNDGSIQIGVRLTKNDLMDEFLNAYPDQRKFVSPRKFKDYLDAFAMFYNLKVSHGRTNSRSWVDFVQNGEEVKAGEFDELDDETPF